MLSVGKCQRNANLNLKEEFGKLILNRCHAVGLKLVRLEHVEEAKSNGIKVQYDALRISLPVTRRRS